jgi:hypothetical protein
MAKTGTSKKGAVESGEDLETSKENVGKFFDKSESAAEGKTGAASGAESKTAETAVIDEDKDGNRFLPGSEIPVPVAIKPLIQKAKEIETVLKPAFASARDALITAQDKLSEIAHKNIEHFSEPDEKGSRTYKCGGVIVKITFEKEKITTKLEDDLD